MQDRRKDKYRPFAGPSFRIEKPKEKEAEAKDEKKHDFRGDALRLDEDGMVVSKAMDHNEPQGDVEAIDLDGNEAPDHDIAEDLDLTLAALILAEQD